MPPASVKLSPPRVPPWYVPRPALEQRLDEAASYRLTSVVAGAGYGKSTHVARKALEHDWAWYTLDAADVSPVACARGLVAAMRTKLPALDEDVVPPGAGGDDAVAAEALASAIATALEAHATGDLVLVVDDVHELGDLAPSAVLIEGLLRYAPPGLRLVLCSRLDPPFAVGRLRGRGEVLDLSALDLAFTTEEVRELLVERLGPAADELASPLREASGGWPAAVRLAAEVLASIEPENRWDIVRALSTRGAPLYAYLAEEVFGRENPEMRRLLTVIVPFDRITPELCEALGVAAAGSKLADLARRGLAEGGPGGVYSLHDLVRQFVRETWPLSAGELRDLQRRAADWFEASGDLEAAMRALIAARDVPALEGLLTRHMLTFIERAAFDTVNEAAALLSPRTAPALVGFLVANAMSHRNEMDEALRWLPEGNPDSRWVRSLIHAMRGEPQVALDVLRPPGGEPVDDPMNLSFVAYHLIGLGRVDEAMSVAERAIELAKADVHSTAFAETQMVQSDLAVDAGDLAAAGAFLELAIEIATEVGNVLLECSARTRLADLRREQGRLDEALAEVDRAVELSDRIGFSHFGAWTALVKGAIERSLGRFDEALVTLGTAVDVNERFASNFRAYPLALIGAIQRERGELAQARSSLERAVASAERSQLCADLATSKAELACTICEEEPDRAESLVGEAIAIARGERRARALLAGGWVALRRAERELAAELAAEAFAEASRRGGPPLLAETLQLRALTAEDRANELALLEEALAISRRLGDRTGEARVVLALGRLSGQAPPAAVEAAEGALREAGMRPGAGGAGLLAEVATGRHAVLEIQTLGRFVVRRAGAPVLQSEWQSKKARDLLKLLVSRRGRTTTRDFLVEALWPGEDPAKTSNRLSVALNVVRNVLDPRGAAGADHYVAADRDGLRLDLSTVAVDLEEFFERAKQGLRFHREHDEAAAAPLLEAAEGAYHGEFLEEDRYEDWALPLREEARTTYLEVARALAFAGPETTRYHLRILALDPYDEDTHLDLVSRLAGAGRHGEARRAYRRYVHRMGEIGVEPAGFSDQPVRQLP